MGRLLGMRLRRNKPELPRKDSPYVQCRAFFEGRRRYAAFGSERFVVAECVCAKLDVWRLESGRWRLQMQLDAPDNTYGFYQELVADEDLYLLLKACRQLDSEHGYPAARPADCLFDDKGNLCGIIVGVELDGKLTVYVC